MIGIAKHALAFVLNVGLIAGGVPAVHAGPAQVRGSDAGNDAMPAHHMMHDHMQHDALAETEIAHTEIAQIGMMGDPSAMGKSSNGFCKGGGSKCCSMCMTAYVAPTLPQMNRVRVGFAVMYWRKSRVFRDVLPFIDPGIPIA